MSDVGWSAVANFANTETGQASGAVAQATSSFLAGRGVGGATVITNYYSPSILFAGGTAGAWYDPSDLVTLFTTSAGTTQCAMPGQGSAVSVGLMLDKSQGLVLGPELVTNGDFSNGTTGWTGSGSGGWLISGGVATHTPPTYGNLSTSASTLTTGGWYRVAFDLVITASFVNVDVKGARTSFNTSGSKTFIIRAGASGPNILFEAADGAFTIDNISVKALPGNHAIAFNDTTARPELRARVNLLTYSEDWTNAVWTGGSDRTNVTTTPNAGTNPIGGSNATRLQGTASNWFQGQTVSLTSLTPLVLSLWVKSNTGSSQTFRLFGTGTAQISSDLTATTDWQQFLFPYTPTNTAQQCGIIRNSSNSTADLLVWGADLRPANIGANVPAYQRIADANTYDTSGFPLYLRFDGIDDSMYTPANLNLSGTDKVSVFAGVRRNTTATMFPVELSAQASANNGAFAIGTDSGGFEYFFDSRGTALQQILIDNAAYNAPVTNVLTLSSAIAAPSLIARINSTQVGTNTSSQGSGNFGTYPLYIGARNNASFFFNGHLYSLIIAGSAVSAGNISATEQWVAQRTGIVIP